MDLEEKNRIFIENPTNEDIKPDFKEKLKNHLSNEYLYIVEKKDDLEAQLLQLRVEQNQKNKTLFPNIDQRGVRKYFSPLNIQDIEEDHKDEKDKQLIINIEKIQNDIDQLNVRMHEIKEFLSDIDDVNHASFPQNVDNTGKNVDYFLNNDHIYPQMLRNLYNLSDKINNECNDIEVLIEFNDNNVETSPELNKYLLEQVYCNIMKTIEIFSVSTILIQGKVTGKNISIDISYVCEEEKIEGLNIIYNIDYL